MRRFVLGVLPKVLDISRFESYHIQAETGTKGGNAMAVSFRDFKASDGSVRRHGAMLVNAVIAYIIFGLFVK